MPACLIDHLVVTAPSLEAGAAFVRQTLGVTLQTGGEHGRMGTHNLLLRLGAATYLEVIAIDPAATPPARPRWFALDTLAPDAAPRLATWVARTDDIHAAAAAATEPVGGIEAMSRGSLDWLITIPADGSLPLDGIAPALIQWRSEPHPAAMLYDRGLALSRLELRHPQPERVSRMLTALGLVGPVDVLPVGDGPSLAAHINTPQGEREIAFSLAS